ncbi:MAG: site-specific integrase [Acidiferrobacteraceae bacterium]
MHNPVRDIRRPRQPKARERRLRPGEEPRLMAACREARNPWLSPLVALALETGMRRSELLALRWAHTDLRKKTVRLLDSKNGEDRGVPLSSRALTVLRTLPRSTKRSSSLSWPTRPAEQSRRCVAAGSLPTRLSRVQCLRLDSGTPRHLVIGGYRQSIRPSAPTRS